MSPPPPRSSSSTKPPLASGFAMDSSNFQANAQKRPGFSSSSQVSSIDMSKSATGHHVTEVYGDGEASVLANFGVERTDGGLLRWRNNCADHPRNWTASRKAFDTAVIVLLEFYTTVISTTGANVAQTSSSDFGFGTYEALVAFTFTYQLGQALGGCVVPPFSEIVGRRTPYLVSCFVFSIACILTAAVPWGPMVFISRFIAGFASAVPSVVIAGSVEDMFNAGQRVWIVVLWNMSTTMGLCFGPIYAAYITAAVGWRWVFYSAAIVTGILFAGVLVIKESRSSLVLGSKIRDIGRQTEITQLQWENPDNAPNMRSLVELVVVRPARLLLTEPIVMTVAAISAVSWGTIYLFTESLITVYVSMGFTPTQASLSFLAVAVGTLFTFLPRLQDRRAVTERRKKGEPIQPEDKISGLIWGGCALCLGLTWFGFTVPPLAHLPWMVPTLGLVLVGFAVNELAYTLSAYLADSYLLYSASAFSGVAFARAIVSGVMPLIGHAMYANLSANRASAIPMGFSVLFLFIAAIFPHHSFRLRQQSPFARYSVEMNVRTQVERD